MYHHVLIYLPPSCRTHSIHHSWLLSGHYVAENKSMERRTTTAKHESMLFHQIPPRDGEGQESALVGTSAVLHGSDNA